MASRRTQIVRSTTQQHRSAILRVSLLCLLASATAVPALSHAQAARSSTVPATEPFQLSPEYLQVQHRLSQGWNTWDVNSVTTEVLLPQALAIHLSLKHNTTEGSEALLTDPLIGRLTPGAEQVIPGPHAWNGSYTDLNLRWKDHSWRVQTAHINQDAVLLVTPLPSSSKAALPPTLIITADFLWNRPGSVTRGANTLDAQSPAGHTSVFCTCEPSVPSSSTRRTLTISPLTGPYFAADLNQPIAISTGSARTLAEVTAIIEREHTAYTRSLSPNQTVAPLTDAIETTLGWDTIFEAERGRVVSPVSRVWSVTWGGYVIFDWDTFFASTMASIGNRDLAYADTVETLRELTPQGFVPNYARSGEWKSSDRSEPPVGAITVLGLYQKYGDRWFLQQTFPALLSWNRWWAQHRDIDGYLTWGSDGQNQPANLDDNSRGTRAGAILESGLDNSPMYDDTAFDSSTHLLQMADVGLMSMYIADCNALATIATTLGKSTEATELHERSTRYAAKLETLWDAQQGIFLNRDLRTGKLSPRLSPTNFYPMLAAVATPAQAQTMVDKHLMNPAEFWGEWVIPSIARNDPAFQDQNYWRGRIWGPLNFLVYLGLRNYDLPQARAALASKSYQLFLKEWRQQGHVHENYNALLGTGDDVSNSDRFYHWGALLGYIQYLETTDSVRSTPSETRSKPLPEPRP